MAGRLAHVLQHAPVLDGPSKDPVDRLPEQLDPLPDKRAVLAALAVALHGQVPVQRLRLRLGLGHLIPSYPAFHRGIEDALRHLDL